MSNNKPKDGVGYGKPPKHSQFKKGKSGNPKGRPAGKKNFSTSLIEMLTSKVPVTENGKTRKKTTIEASFARLREKALKGDLRALEKVLDFAERFGADQTAKEEENDLTQAEASILKEFENRIRRETEQALSQPQRADDSKSPQDAMPNTDKDNGTETSP